MEYSFVLRAVDQCARLGNVGDVLDVASGPSIFPAIVGDRLKCKVTAVDIDQEVIRT